jgi:hypothetical protein
MVSLKPELNFHYGPQQPKITSHFKLTNFPTDINIKFNETPTKLLTNLAFVKTTKQQKKNTNNKISDVESLQQ